MKCMILQVSHESALRLALRSLKKASIKYSVASSYPIEESLNESSPQKLSVWFFMGGFLVGVMMYALALYSVFDYPLNIAGQPLHHPGFVPAIYVVVILGATLVGALGFFFYAPLLHYDSNRWQEKWGGALLEGGFLLRFEYEEKHKSLVDEILEATGAGVLERDYD